MQFIMIAVGDLHSIIALKCPGCLLHIISIKSLLLIFIYGPTCVVETFLLVVLSLVKNQPRTVSNVRRVARVARVDEEIVVWKEAYERSGTKRYFLLRRKNLFTMDVVHEIFMIICKFKTKEFFLINFISKFGNIPFTFPTNYTLE